MNNPIIEAVTAAPYFNPEHVAPEPQHSQVAENQAPHKITVNAITMSDLMATTYDPLSWVIEDLLPEGLTVLAGAPKMGKSWMALEIALAVALGGTALGAYAACNGVVLYLALEDNYRRLQQRLLKIAYTTKDGKESEGASSQYDEMEMTKNLFLSYQIPGMDEGGIEALGDWLVEHPRCKLVIIDTLARFTPKSTNSNVNAYERDYPVLVRLQQLATQRGISLLVIHHTKKKKEDDPLEELSGSNGIAGAADAIWVLKRPRTESCGTLMVTGRDIEELQLEAGFDKETCRWTLRGDERQEGRRKILAALTENFQGEPFTYKKVTAALRVSVTEAKRIVYDLLQSAHVTRVSEKAGKEYQFKIMDNKEKPSVHNHPEAIGRLNESSDAPLGSSVQPSNEIDLVCGEV